MSGFTLADAHCQNPASWNSAHGSRGCSQANLRGTGGNGYFYCFAADAPNADTAIEGGTWSRIKALFGE